MDSAHRKHFRFSIFLILCVIVSGITGYILIEHYPLLDALYMTVITVATVGFQEVHQLSVNGRIFTIILIISSFGIFAYALTSISTYLIDLQINYFIRGGRRLKEIKKMKNHVIICGYGRLGRQVTAELNAYKTPLVVVEKDKNIINMNQDSGILFVEGDATEDEILLKAGITHAKSLVTTMPIDADNLYIVLSARGLKPDLNIITRASADHSDSKLRVAGARHVVMPEKVGGSHMASLIAKPDVLEFYTHLTVQGDEGVNLIEVVCSDLPDELRDKTIHDLSIRRLTGANIVGYKTPEGEFIINPPPDTLMLKHAKLFVLGTTEQIRKMREIIKV